MNAQTDFRDRILSEVRKNRISSVEVADALRKTGVLHGVHALNTRHFQAGIVKYIPTWGESNWPLHDAIQHVGDGDLVYVDVINCGARAPLGDIVAKYLFLYQRIGGLVVNGLVRDSHRLIKEDYPIWCTGSTPLGCFNNNVDLDSETKSIIDARRAIIDGSILVCDDSGCTSIASARHDEATLRRLEFIEFQEDVWYYCIDTLKWSTYETICLKRYMDDQDLLPDFMRKKLAEFES